MIETYPHLLDHRKRRLFQVLRHKLDNLPLEFRECLLQVQLIQQQQHRQRNLHCMLLEKHQKRRHNYRWLQHRCKLLDLHRQHSYQLEHLHQYSHQVVQLHFFLDGTVVCLFVQDVVHEHHRNKRVREVLLDNIILVMMKVYIYYNGICINSIKSYCYTRICLSNTKM